MKFKVVVATYNVPHWIKRCLDSIASQDDEGFEVCVVDDGSPPESGQPELVRELCEANGWECILNERRIGGPLPNQVAAIRRLGGDPLDVIVFVDGDDWLPHDHVLSYMREVYANSDVWVAYGSQRTDPPSPTTQAARRHPPEAWQHPRSVRGWTWENGIHFNHIRSFRYGLFLRMDPIQWHWPNGDWLVANGDSVMIVPALEMAGYHHTRFMDEVTYVYTPDHPLSEWSTRAQDVNPLFLNQYEPYGQLEAL